MLEVRGLTKDYGTGEVAVDGVDLTIADGELFVIVGPSGCGKTTVLRMIAGLEVPTAGDVLLDGTRITGLSPQERDVAMTFQGGALYPNMTVAENIGFALKAAGVEHHEIDRRVAAVAGMLHVSDVLEQRPHRLSGGERQRVAMGRAIIRHPQVFLMDEPLSHLDTKLRVETRAAIVGLQRRLGVTTVFVTHDQAEAMAMADRVAVMRGGHVVQCDAPMELYEHPSDVFVATFIGSPPMCVLRAIVGVREQVPGLRLGSHWLPWPDLFARCPALTGDGPPAAVALGIRQEALTVDDDGPLMVSVVAIEDLGHERLLHTNLVGEQVRAGPDGTVTVEDAVATVYVSVRGGTDADRGIDLWKPVRLAVDTSLLYLFDLSTGAAIPQTDSA